VLVVVDVVVDVGGTVVVVVVGAKVVVVEGFADEGGTVASGNALVALDETSSRCGGGSRMLPTALIAKNDPAAHTQIGARL